MASKRILVLGASGFIGGRVVAAMTGTELLAVAGRYRAAPPPKERHESVHVDATSDSSLCQALEGIDGIVNCVAGEPQTIVASACALRAAASRMGTAPQVVHLSSMAVYGLATGSVDESAPMRSDLSAYGSAKARAEVELLAYPATVILRPGIVYGPGSNNWSELIGALLLAGRLGDLGDEGLGYCNLVHVDDVAAAVVRALTVPALAGQVFNLALASPPTWNDYFLHYADALGAPHQRISASRLFLELNVASPALMLASLVARRARLGLQPPAAIRPWLIALCRHRLRIDTRKATDVLGMQWTPLERGLQQTAQWLHAKRGHRR